MNEKQLTEEQKILKKHLDIAEIIGFDRGVETIFIILLQTMEEDKMMAISYESIKKLYKAIKEKQNEEQRTKAITTEVKV